MNIGLVDVDGHNYPNLALMISAWHKNRGHRVEFADMFGQYDVLYAGKVFLGLPTTSTVMPRARQNAEERDII